MDFLTDPNSSIMVPIKLDALFVPQDGIQVVEPMVNFTKLPHSVQGDNGLRFFNSNEPYISETVLSTPLSDKNFNLGSGMHLHWALPDGYTKTSPLFNMNFPRVPNRWLVVRKSADPSVTDAKWIVLSDYLWPAGIEPSTIETTDGIVPPVVAYHHQRSLKSEEPDQIPFRYLGYVQKFDDDWDLPSNQQEDYVERLTAIGYGDPLFAAYYPNCMGVFGIHDTDIKENTRLSQISYEVYGWFGEGEVEEVEEGEDGENGENGEEGEEGENGGGSWIGLLEEEYGITVDYQEGDLMPEHSVFFAKIQFTADSAPAVNDVQVGGSAIEVCVGNTNTEALSAYLAHKMSPEQKAIQNRIESQLESLHLAPQLQDRPSDLGPAFEEKRHSQSFHAVAGGHLWDLKIEGAREAGKDQLHDIYRNEDAAELALQNVLKDRLHQINLWQEEYNQSWTMIRSMQQLIFSDWQKYMQAVYHDPIEDTLSEDGSPYPDMDAAMAHIENMIALLQYRKAYTGIVIPEEDDRADIPWETTSFELPYIPFSDLKYLLTPQDEPLRYWVEEVLPTLPNPNDPKPAPFLAKEIALRIYDLRYAFSDFKSNAIDMLRMAEPLLRSNFEALPEEHLARIAEIFELTPEEFLAQGHLSSDQIQFLVEGFHESMDGEGYFDFPYNMVEMIDGLDDPLKQLEALGPAIDFISDLAKLPGISLQKIAAPRFWEPREPVVLLAGPAAQTTDRYGMDGQGEADGLLRCFRLEHAVETDINKPILPLAVLQDFLADHGEFALRLTDGAPWHSLFFEWEVRVDPMRKNDNVDPDDNNYSPDFLTSHYDLNNSLSEFAVSDSGNVDELDHYFSGRSIMTPFALDKLEYELDQFLIKETQAYLQHKSPKEVAEQQLLQLAPSDPDYNTKWLEYFRTNKQEVIDYHGQVVHQASGKADGTAAISAAASPLQTALDTIDQIETLRTENIHIQSQSLSGFNQALLMLHETYQLEIAEPNGFEEYRTFSNKVRQVVGRNNKYAGMSVGSFHPLRTGRMHLNRLRVVDTFGRTFGVIDQSKEPEHQPPIYGSQWMNPDAETNAFNLAPRITQAARLHFRWLAADGSDVYTNAQPDTNPICGWVIINRLDGSLMIYASSGEPLGYMEGSGRWRVYPSRSTPLQAEQIENLALRKMVLWLMNEAAAYEGTANNFMEMFLSDLEQIMEDIAPDSYAQHNARSLLMGRPLALVQAAVDVHLMGRNAVRQDLSLFKTMVEGQNQTYTDDQFTKVEIPIRIGERQRLNDGLVCYWMDEGTGYKDGHFFAPFDKSDATLESFEGNQITFQQALDAPPQRLSILMDPRGLIHCTTGILPTKALSLPLRYVTSALEKLQISFLSTPLLSAPRKLTLSLPAEAGYAWAWLQQDGNSWTKLSNRLRLQKADVLQAFDYGEQLWALLIQENWIELQEHDPEAAFLVKPTERRNPSPTSLAEALSPNDATDKQLEALQVNIATTLWNLATGITLPKTTAFFGETAEIREGWLTLRPVPKQPIGSNK